MPEIRTYTLDTLPTAVKWQIASFVRMEWTFVYEDDPYWDYFTGKTVHAATIVLVEGDVVISHAEANQRIVTHNGIAYTMYGVSAVFTYPGFRGKGYGRQIVEAVTAYIDRTDADAAMLFCAPERVPFYAASGWEEVDTPVLFGAPDNPQTKEYGKLMMRFLSEKGRRARTDFEQQPVYVGPTTW